MSVNLGIWNNSIIASHGGEERERHNFQPFYFSEPVIKIIWYSTVNNPWLWRRYKNESVECGLMKEQVAYCGSVWFHKEVNIIISNALTSFLMIFSNPVLICVNLLASHYCQNVNIPQTITNKNVKCASSIVYGPNNQ